MKWTIPPWIKVLVRYAYRSFREFRYLFVFAFMPVWLGALLRLLQGRSVPEYLNGYLSNGEALLLCTATVGPLLFIIMLSDDKVVEGHKRFPFRETYNITIYVICIISAAVLGLKAALGETGVISLTVVWLMSALLSVISLIVWFAVVGTNAARETAAPEIMRQDTQDFINSYGDSHGQ